MRYTKEEIREAKEADLAELLQKLGVGLRRFGKGYLLEEHDSLKLNGGSYWYWHSKNIGSKSCIDYLMQVGISGKTYAFMEAVSLIRRTMGYEKGIKSLKAEEAEYNMNKNKGSKEKANKAKLPFIIPQKSFIQKRLFGYLTGRGIEYKLIKYLVEKDYICEEYKTHNAVFLGRDYEGNIKYAAIRGTLSDKRFAGEVSGSDKRYGFRIDVGNGKSGIVKVYESPIDLMSYISLKREMNDTYISLGGVSTSALDEYMKVNMEKVKEIHVCTDNDKAGLGIYEKIKEKYKNFTVIDERPKFCKDYNDELMLYKKTNEEREIK